MPPVSPEEDTVKGRGSRRSAMVVGIVLAAGAGSRMGASKPLVPEDGDTLLGGLVRALKDGGCARVVVVSGGQASAAVEEVARTAGAEVVRNPAPESEQIDSLRVALEHLDPGVEAAVVTPVDRPGLLPRTVSRILHEFERTGAPVVIPTWQGEPGHPTLFAAALFKALRSPDLPDVIPTWQGEPGHPTLFAAALFKALRSPDLPNGARTVIARHEEAAARVEIDDPGIPVDLDTAEDVRRWRRMREGEEV